MYSRSLSWTLLTESIRYLINCCKSRRILRKKTRQVKNNDKSKKYILRGHRNTIYHEKNLSNKKNLVILHDFILIQLGNYACAKTMLH